MDTMTANPDEAKIQIAGARFDCVRILADDLTGACDSAAPFAACGLGVRVWLGEAGTADEPVQAFNTTSRGLEPKLAAEAVARAAEGIAGGRRTLWFKKVDSAGRGAIAAELRAAHRSLQTRAILFAPSFPEAGRTVAGGVLRVEDAAGVRTINLVDLLAPEFSRMHRVAAAWEVASTLDGGGVLLVCDAATSGDLEDLAAVDEPGLLYAGSAGLARALARLGAATMRVEKVPQLKRAMTVCGTPHPATQMQMTHLSEALPEHPRVHVTTNPGDAALIVEQFERHDPEALLLTGGDTALLALAALGAHSIALRGELTTGIPWGFVRGGMADGRIVVTKSGGFGDTTCMTRIVRRLTGETAA
jgi:D-threonate/D-erythronate kinase